VRIIFHEQNLNRSVDAHNSPPSGLDAADSVAHLG
jgi:hypothetical protein